jgi:hypothetical protein
MRVFFLSRRWRVGVLCAASLLSTGGTAVAAGPALAAEACLDVDVVVARGTGELLLGCHSRAMALAWEDAGAAGSVVWWFLRSRC